MRIIAEIRSARHLTTSRAILECLGLYPRAPAAAPEPALDVEPSQPTFEPFEPI